MDIAVQIDSPEPVYEQIVRQIRDGVSGGELAAGAPLPPVRQLATDLVLNRNTVARAYKMLEEQGVIQTAGRKGTFVRDGAAEEVTRLKAGNAERLLRQTIGALTSDGLGRDEIAAIFNRVLGAELRKVEQR
jgi:GntR family transcriptional regulator